MIERLGDLMALLGPRCHTNMFRMFLSRHTSHSQELLVYKELRQYWTGSKNPVKQRGH